MKETVTRIVPTAVRRPEPLHDEYLAHLAQAQRYHEAALEAEQNDAQGVQALRYRAIAEQNAALLCQGQLLIILLSGLLHMLDDGQRRPSLRRSTVGRSEIQ